MMSPFEAFYPSKNSVSSKHVPTEGELKAFAGNCYDIGIPCIPVKIYWDNKKQRYEKKFLDKWSVWQTRAQTEEELRAFSWQDVNGVALVFGSKAKNDLYLTAIDYDVKGNLSEENKKKGLEILAEFPKTCVEQTVNLGLHLLFWSVKPAKNINSHHAQTGIELLGSPHLCIRAPSYGYTTLNNYDIAIVEDIEQLYLHAMKKHGIIKEQTHLQQQPQAEYQRLHSGQCIQCNSFTSTLNQENLCNTCNQQYSTQPQPQSVSQTKFNEPRPCIQAALQRQLTGSSGHQMRLCIAAELKLYNFTEEEIIELFTTQRDFNYEKSKNQVKSADPTKTLTCKTIKNLGYCLHEKCPTYTQNQNKENNNNTTNKDITKDETLDDKIKQFQEKYGKPLQQLETDLHTLSVNPNIENFILDKIHKNVSNHDDHIIKIVLYTAISAYLSPLNLALKCESGSGKTYSTIQTLKFLPPEDIQYVGSQSPKVISHENGLLLDKNGEPILEA